jgi:hypothetical protein
MNNEVTFRHAVVRKRNIFCVHAIHRERERMLQICRLMPHTFPNSLESEWTVEILHRIITLHILFNIQNLDDISI